MKKTILVLLSLAIVASPAFAQGTTTNVSLLYGWNGKRTAEEVKR